MRKSTVDTTRHVSSTQKKKKRRDGVTHLRTPGESWLFLLRTSRRRGEGEGEKGEERMSGGEKEYWEKAPRSKKLQFYMPLFTFSHAVCALAVPRRKKNPTPSGYRVSSERSAAGSERRDRLSVCLRFFPRFIRASNSHTNFKYDRRRALSYIKAASVPLVIINCYLVTQHKRISKEPRWETEIAREMR